MKNKKVIGLMGILMATAMFTLSSPWAVAAEEETAETETLPEERHEADPEAVYLSDLEWKNAVDGWFLIRKDQTVIQTDITWEEDGKTESYEKGIGTCGPSQVTFDITGLHAKTFKAVGCFQVDEGSAEFAVLADGQEIYSKKLSYDGNQITPDNGYIEAEIPEGAKTLTLYVKDRVRVSWADARLYCDDEAQNELSRISLKAEETWLQPGEETDLTLDGFLGKVSAEGLQNEKADMSKATVTYKSSNENVAKVEDGKLIAVSDGTSAITCQAELNGVTQETVLNVIVGKGNEQSWRVTSPDGSIEELFTLDENGALLFAVSRNSNTVIGCSQTGLVTNLGDFSNGLTFEDYTEEEVTDSYDLIGAKKSHVDATGKEMTLHFQKDGVKYRIVSRIYNDGVAFHYEIEGDEGETLTISSEKTSFLMPNGSVAQTMDFDKANEQVYIEKTAEQLEGGYSMPMLYKTKSEDYALLSEAELTPQYCGAQIMGNSSGALDVVFSPEQFTDVETTAPFSSPWRYMVIGDLKDITENTMAETLSPDCEIEDTSWIEAGPTDWTWLNGDLRHDNLPEGTTWEETAPKLYKEYIDFAAEMGWEYQLLDEGWQPRVYDRGNDLYDGYYDWTQEVLDYAKEKGVKIIVWANKRDLDTPEELARLKEWHEMGIAGIKPDFFDSQSQEIVQLLDEIKKVAAENELLVNIHGAGKPDGERRTYPNVISREAVNGAEGEVNDAYLNCTLPFTRFAVGGADFTPMASYGNIYDDSRAVTQTHLMAETVMFECGVQTMADKPEVYREHVGYENFFKNLPTDWDDIHFISGDPGHYAALARRSGDNWYVSVLCNEEHQEDISLDFLDEGEYTAYIFRDGEDPTNDDTNVAIETETKTVTSADTLEFDIPATGGVAIKLEKK